MPGGTLVPKETSRGEISSQNLLQKNAVIYFFLQNISEVVHEGNFLKLLRTAFKGICMKIH